MWPFLHGLCFQLLLVKGLGRPGATPPSSGPPGVQSPLETRPGARGQRVACSPSLSVSLSFRKLAS